MIQNLYHKTNNIGGKSVVFNLELNECNSIFSQMTSTRPKKKS